MAKYICTNCTDPRDDSTPPCELNDNTPDVPAPSRCPYDDKHPVWEKVHG